MTFGYKEILGASIDEERMNRGNLGVDAFCARQATLEYGNLHLLIPDPCEEANFIAQHNLVVPPGGIMSSDDGSNTSNHLGEMVTGFARGIFDFLRLFRGKRPG